MCLHKNDIINDASAYCITVWWWLQFWPYGFTGLDGHVFVVGLSGCRERQALGPQWLILRPCVLTRDADYCWAIYFCARHVLKYWILFVDGLVKVREMVNREPAEFTPSSNNHWDLVFKCTGRRNEMRFRPAVALRAKKDDSINFNSSSRSLRLVVPTHPDTPRKYPSFLQYIYFFIYDTWFHK